MRKPGIRYQDQEDRLCWLQGEVAACNDPFGILTRSASTQDLIHTVWLQVYTVALYVDAAPAKATLNFPDSSTDSVCSALFDGHFQKVLQIHMLRDVTSTQFKDGLKEYLVPRLKKYGGNEYLETFMDFFSDKHVGKGSEIPLLWPGQKRLSCMLHHHAVSSNVLGHAPFASAIAAKESEMTLLVIPFMCMHGHPDKCLAGTAVLIEIVILDSYLDAACYVLP